MLRPSGGKGKVGGSVIRSFPYATAARPVGIVAKPARGAAQSVTPKVTHASEDPDEGRMIYVGGVPASAEWQELKDHMKQAGTVEFVQVLTDQSNRPRGVGFVRYSSADEAHTAIAELNGTVMEGMAPGKTLLVDNWTGEKPKTNKGRSKSGADSGIVCGGGCGKGSFGEGYGGGKGKGGGLWLSWEQYQMMSQMMMMKGMGKKGAGKNPAAHSPGFGSKDPTFKVRVEGLADACRWQELKDHMKQAGTVEFCNVAAGQGEVRFSCAEEAQNAVETLDGSELMGTLIVVAAWSEDSAG